ncbi:MAG: hypothetical protein JSS91_09500 [Bacteroidetes bacterium]|nr:hypothetical protein [Bacteroidota bacterium]
MRYADKKSYELYNQGKWNELIAYSENAISKKIDFIFLRVRLGVAYYETGKYFDAIINLKRAFDQGYENPFVIENLYYSYLQAGRPNDAEFYFYKLPNEIREKIRPLDNSFMTELNADAGTGISNDKSSNSGVDLDGADNVYGEQILYDNYFFLNAGFKQKPLRWLSISYSYNYLSLKKTKEIMYNDSRISDDYTQQQQQFYNEYEIRAGDGFVISPSGHYIFTKDNTVYANYDSLSVRQTKGNDSVLYYYTVTKRESIQDNFVLSLNLSKQFYNYKAAVHGSFSYLNGAHQTQFGASLTAYPLKKNTFYTFSDLLVHTQNSDHQVIFFQSAGGKLYKELWGEVFATFGRINNYNEQNGALVFNNPDVIKFKLGAEFNYYFNKNLSASLVYVYQKREKNYLIYKVYAFNNLIPLSRPEFVKLDYSVNTILAGLKLYF